MIILHLKKGSWESFVAILSCLHKKKNQNGLKTCNKITKSHSSCKSIKIDVLEVKRCSYTSNKFLKKFHDDSRSFNKNTPKWLEDLQEKTIMPFLLIWCINRNHKIAKLYRTVKEKFLMLLLKFQIIRSSFLRNLWKKKPRCKFEGLKKFKIMKFYKRINLHQYQSWIGEK